MQTRGIHMSVNFGLEKVPNHTFFNDGNDVEPIFVAYIRILSYNL